MTLPPLLLLKVSGMVWVTVFVRPLPFDWLEVTGGAPGTLENPKAELPGPLVLVLTCWLEVDTPAVTSTRSHLSLTINKTSLCQMT